MKIRRWAAVLLTLLLLTVSACGGKTVAPENPTEGEDMTQYDLKAFDLDKYIAPVWDGAVCYAEAAFVRENEAGAVEPIRLLYDIETIVSVRSADLQTVYT